MTIVVTNSKTGAEIRREFPEAADACVSIGRNDACDIILEGTSVSRRHAEIFRAGAAVFIRDSGSTGGTFVGGARIEGPVPFAPGAKAKVGDWEVAAAESSVSEDGRDVCMTNMTNMTMVPTMPSVPAAGAKPPTPVAAPKPRDFAEEFKDAGVLYTPEMMGVSKVIHQDVLDKLNLAADALNESSDAETKANVEAALDQTIKEHRHEIPLRIPMPLLRQALLDELLGFGPLSPLIRSKDISEIMVNGPDTVFVESKGRLFDSGV